MISIPFKRESVLQVRQAPAQRTPEAENFHSLQTGKCIASLILSFVSFATANIFPFPSNGKVYCKTKQRN